MINHLNLGRVSQITTPLKKKRHSLAPLTKKNIIIKSTKILINCNLEVFFIQKLV